MNTPKTHYDMVILGGGLAGLSRKRPFVAAIFAILMFSLIGLPPLAGFFAKYFVFVAAIEAKLYALAIIGVVAALIGMANGLRTSGCGGPAITGRSLDPYFEATVDAAEEVAEQLEKGGGARPGGAVPRPGAQAAAPAAPSTPTPGPAPGLSITPGI